MGIYTVFKNLCGLSGPKRYYGGNSGYVGYSKSKRAVDAEERGLRSISNMDTDFKNQVNALIIENGGRAVSLKEIKEAAKKKIIPDEWHHTSMYGNKTDYYAPETIANYFSPGVAEREAEKRYQEAVKANEEWRQQREETERKNNELVKKISSRLGWFTKSDKERFATPYSNLFIEVRLNRNNPLDLHANFVKERWSHVQNTTVTTNPGRNNRNLQNDFPLALPLFDEIQNKIDKVKEDLSGNSKSFLAGLF